MDFSSALKAERKKKKMTQAEIAALLLIDQSTYSGYERGQHEPDYEKLRSICIALDCSADHLLGLPTPPDDPVLVAYRNAPPVRQEDICRILGVAYTRPSVLTSSVSTFVPGGVYERAGK